MISIASSIRFRKADGLLQSFDNTLHEEQRHFRVARLPYCHKFLATDTVTIQAEVEVDLTLEMQYAEGTVKNGVIVWGEFQNMTGETKVFDGTYYDYYECPIDFSAFSTPYVKFKALIMDGESVEESWYSEPCEVVDDSDYLLQIEFFNLENAFGVYYENPTEDDRISHLLRIRGRLRQYKPAGETSVYDNQDEVVKTSDEVKRVLTLETEAIPAYLAEMLAVALAHDKFFINEVEFVAEGKPEYNAGNGDLASLTVALTQRDVIGLNSHDVGFDCDSITGTNMIVLQELAASGENSFTLTDEYMVLTITGEWVTGAPVIKAGTTPGGDELLASMELTESGNQIEVAIVPVDKAALTAGVIYFTVSGSGATANVYMQTFKNRQ